MTHSGVVNLSGLIVASTSDLMLNSSTHTRHPFCSVGLLKNSSLDALQKLDTGCQPIVWSSTQTRLSLSGLVLDTTWVH